MQYDQHLDTKGLNCPLPILKTKLLINKMAVGETLLVEATDPHSKIDFEAWCASTGHTLTAVKETSDGIFCFYIRCCAAPQRQDKV